MTPIKAPKKLIEVALPLDDINEASIREKSIRSGHPSTLHLWWARRPLAAARAVIFAQLVNDPGYERSLGRGVNKEKAKIERERLFEIIRRMVQWGNTNDEEVMAEARAEIKKSWVETCRLNQTHPEASTLFNPEVLPPFHDPFSGGGALPLEAQRLGLHSYATDLNPVAVVINKAMIEIPPSFASKGPVGPIPKNEKQTSFDRNWNGASGLAEDVRRYGAWLRDEAERRIGGIYPKAKIPAAMGGGTATVIAWLWARTVKSPNPAYSHVHVPLVSSYVLAKKRGKEAWIRPIIKGDSYHFEVIHSPPGKDAEAGTKAAGRGSNFICLLSGVPINGDYIKSEGQAGRMGYRLLAIVAEGNRRRNYISPTEEIEKLALSAKAEWAPTGRLPEKLSGGSCVPYGLVEWGDLFTSRQLLALNTFHKLVYEVRAIIKSDALKSGYADDGVDLDKGGTGAVAYSQAICTYLAFAISRLTVSGCTLVTWNSTGEKAQRALGRQSLPMTWDFAETNMLADATGSLSAAIDLEVDPLRYLGFWAKGKAEQKAAQEKSSCLDKYVVSTDPPYYDNIFYADLSDFFYVWLRKSLREIYPDLFSTIVVPKDEELVATAHRHGGKDSAEKFFLSGMTEALRNLSNEAHPTFPVTIYYAFKQTEESVTGLGNTGWETFLDAIIRSGFLICGTWPIRTELTHWTKGEVNSLASSIVLVCRKRDEDSPSISRRDYVRELKENLAEAVEVMIGGSEGVSPVAPVDLAQAVIGPGMAIFSKYSAVLEADGSPMTVHTALTLINRMLTEGTDDFDPDTQFCLGWFDEQGWSSGEFGKAEVLTKAKGTSVDHIRAAGVVEASAGKVRLLKPAEYPSNWRPENDNNTPVWEALHQLIRELRAAGESAAGVLLAGMPQRADPVRNLAYRLYTLCERKGWAEDARAYNELITSWISIEAASHEKGHVGSQANLEI